MRKVTDYSRNSRDKHRRRSRSGHPSLRLDRTLYTETTIFTMSFKEEIVYTVYESRGETNVFW